MECGVLLATKESERKRETRHAGKLRLCCLWLCCRVAASVAARARRTRTERRDRKSERNAYVAHKNTQNQKRVDKRKHKVNKKNNTTHNITQASKRGEEEAAAEKEENKINSHSPIPCPFASVFFLHSFRFVCTSPSTFVCVCVALPAVCLSTTATSACNITDQATTTTKRSTSILMRENFSFR